MKPTTESIDDVLRSLETQELHPTRQLACKLVAGYRRPSAIDPSYDFNSQPRELRQVFYDATVRFSRRRWWVRWLLR